MGAVAPANGSTALTGRAGRFFVGQDQIARCTNWDVNEKLAHVSEWGDSDSEGYTCRAAGRKDCTFATQGKYDTAADQVELFGLDLFHPDDCVEATLEVGAIQFYAFPRALCSDFKVSINVDTEEVIGWSADWGADGTFSGLGMGGTAPPEDA